MAYIDHNYFAGYTNTKIGWDEFTTLAERASDVIDALTMYKIVAAGFDTLPLFVQGQIKKATAAQVETLYNQGGIDAITGNADSAALTGSIGKFSFSTGRAGETDRGIKNLDGVPLSPLIKGYLFPTGLLYSGLVVR